VASKFSDIAEFHEELLFLNGSDAFSSAFEWMNLLQVLTNKEKASQKKTHANTIKLNAST
jgi:hypothetical protein